MKQTIGILAVLLLIPLLLVVPVQAKPGAQFIPWHLSGAVMPSPPWGLHDVSSSDMTSKLIVNQPNGKTQATITGVMNGLAPNTLYTVYISNGWTASDKWNIVGDWSLQFMYAGSPYVHDMTVATQDMWTGQFTGYGHYVPNPSYTWTITGTVSGTTVAFRILYTGTNAGYYVDATGTIANDGIMSGPWSNPSQSGTWSSTVGVATQVQVGNGWPGLFNGQQTFTFMTDAYGSSSWHVNLKSLAVGSYPLSVWINDSTYGATVLISDNFTVTI